MTSSKTTSKNVSKNVSKSSTVTKIENPVVIETKATEVAPVTDVKNVTSTVTKIENPVVIETKAKEVTPVTDVKNVTVEVPNSISKAQQALKMFDDSEDKSRKTMMNRFQTELGLTKAGASTYLQNIRKRRGLVTH